MKTPIEYLIEKLTESGHLWLTDKPSDMDELSLIIKNAKEMEQNGYQNLINKFIKNREQTRPLIFENGFIKGFEEGAKYSEEFWNELQKTNLDEEDFTRQYLQDKCNEYLKSEGENILI